MIVSIWVFFMLGDSLEQAEHRTAYVQVTASQTQHIYAPEQFENACAEEFHQLYPDYVVCESGWHRQQVQVMGE